MIGLIELGIGLKELGIGLIELGIVLKIDNARRTILARVSGLVKFVFFPSFSAWIGSVCIGTTFLLSSLSSYMTDQWGIRKTAALGGLMAWSGDLDVWMEKYKTTAPLTKTKCH